MHTITDTQLPALQMGFDLQAITASLRPLWQGQGGSAPVVTSAQLLDHKPGQRALIQYHCQPANGSGSQLLGKLYADHQQARRVYHNLDLLWNQVFGKATTWGTPRPVGLLAEWGLLLYEPVGGQPLDALLLTEQGGYWLAQTGGWLAHLHRQRLPLEKRFDFASELTNLRHWAAVVTEALPVTAATCTRLVAYLTRATAQLDFTAQTPIHKDFHYQHVLVSAAGTNRLQVIDFDEMRLGDPNFDLAHFCANLHLLALRQAADPQQWQPLEQAFLHSYARHTGWQPGQRFTYFYIYTCLKIARQLALGFGPHPRPSGLDRQQQIQLMLGQAEKQL